MWLILQPLMRQIALSILLSFAGKLGHLFLLWVLKKLLKGLHWAAKHTDITLDDEVLDLMDRALLLVEQEPVGPKSVPSVDANKVEP
jgi:hypothetical protein